MAALTALVAVAGLGVGLVAGATGREVGYTGALALLLVPLWAAFAVRVPPSISLSAGLGLSVFSGNWETLGVPLGLDRIVLAAAVAGVAVRAVSDRAYRPLLLPVHWLLLVVAAYTIGSALWVGTLTEHDAFFALADRLGLISFVLFFVAPVVFRTPEQRGHLLVALVGVGAYLGVTALLEGVGLKELVLPRYIADENVGIHFDRARGPFVEAAANGLALFGCAVAGAMAAQRWRGAARQLAWAVVALCGIGILFTLTRQAWLGAALGALVGIAATPRLREYAAPLIAAGALLVVGAFAFVPDLRERAGERAREQRPVWDRLNSDRAAVKMIGERPLLGWGWGRFGAESDGFYEPARDYPVTHVETLHSVVLSNAVELGLIGVTLWAAALLLAVGTAIVRRGPPDLDPWRLGLLAFFVCWLVVANFTPLGYTFNNYLLWVWAGLLSVRDPAGRRTAPAAGPR